MDRPSGENAGLVTPLRLSVPGIGLASSSDIERRYKRLFATYTTCVPSGEIATARRPRLVSSWFSPNGMDKRVTARTAWIVDGFTVQDTIALISGHDCRDEGDDQHLSPSGPRSERRLEPPRRGPDAYPKERVLWRYSLCAPSNPS